MDLADLGEFRIAFLSAAEGDEYLQIDSDNMP
jgi:hypothetical protein